jgi:hypothetical protein
MLVILFMVLLLGVFALFMIYLLSWNIPVVILRMVGNKGRPLLIITKGKKRSSGGVFRLFVKGYSKPIRDFKAENYYPSVKGKYGGLILWEFEDGYLTPCLPKRFEKKLTPEERVYVEKANEILNKFNMVGFSFDKALHDGLLLKAIDDVDIEFMIEEEFRLASQYTGGLREFLAKYAGHILVVLIGCFLLIGFIVWLDKAPEMMAQCAGAAKSAVMDSLQGAAANAGVPMG